MVTFCYFFEQVHDGENLLKLSHSSLKVSRAQTIAIIMVDIVDVSFILRILSAGDSSRDWSEKVRGRSHEPNV